MSLDTDVIAASTQVKLQLTTRDPDFWLPEHTGPILVNTSMISDFSIFVPNIYPLTLTFTPPSRLPPLCALHAREYSSSNAQADPF